MDKKLTGIKSSLPASVADFSLKLSTSKYSCWPRLFQPTVCSYTIRSYAVQ